MLQQQELLIRIDAQNQILGYESKARCHQGNGLLHRAFSIFIFNEQKQLLIQKRSAQKPLWPLYWSNSVCSHPRKGEDDLEAAHRRLQEELGITTSLTFVFRFTYQATFEQAGSEHELCSVYIGHTQSEIQANPDEIEDWKYVDIEELNRDIAARPHHYTPWFKLEWERLQHESPLLDIRTSMVVKDEKDFPC